MDRHLDSVYDMLLFEGSHTNEALDKMLNAWNKTSFIVNEKPEVWDSVYLIQVQNN